MMLKWKMVQSYYGVHGGATTQYPVYGSGPALAAGGMMSDGVVFYLYLQYGGEGSGGGSTTRHGYGVNYPPQAYLFQYSPIASTAGYARQY